MIKIFLTLIIKIFVFIAPIYFILFYNNEIIDLATNRLKKYTGNPPVKGGVPEFLDPSNQLYNKFIKTYSPDELKEYIINNPDKEIVYQYYQDPTWYHLYGFPCDSFNTTLYFKEYFFGLNTWVFVLLFAFLFICFHKILFNWYLLILKINKKPKRAIILLNRNGLLTIYPTIIYYLIIAFLEKIDLYYLFKEEFVLGFYLGLIIFLMDFINGTRLFLKQVPEVSENPKDARIVVTRIMRKNSFLFFEGHYLEMLYVFFFFCLFITFLQILMINLGIYPSFSGKPVISENRPELYSTMYTYVEPECFKHKKIITWYEYLFGKKKKKGKKKSKK